MPALEPIHRWFGVTIDTLSKKEILILEAELFLRICEELKEHYRAEYKEYFCLMKFTIEMENAMLDANYVRFAIRDIFLSKEYTLSGLAYYTETPEEVAIEIASGCNSRPSAIFLERVISIHRLVKRELYEDVLKKIISDARPV